MFEYVIHISLFLTLVRQGECLYAGERCVDGGQAGVCMELEKCIPILLEIRNAGSPMPMHMRQRLEDLQCGFEGDTPVICCSSNGSPSPEPSNREKIPDTDKRGTGIYFAPDNNSANPTSTTIEDDSNKSGTISNSIDSPPNIQGHRNLDLIPTNCGVVEMDRIYGGNETNLFEMPWMVLLSYNSARGPKLVCGGTLITKWYVLTAAHCVSFLGNRLTLNGVILGEYDVRSNPDCETIEEREICAPNVRNVSIDSVIAHPGYTPQTLFDDIALIRLSEPADFSLDSMKPICLPITSALQTQDLIEKMGTVAGWGATENGLQSPVLLSVDLPIIDGRKCEEAYKNSIRIQEKQICAGGVKDKDSCGGDSGGPLIFPGSVGSTGHRFVQRGIVSYGSKRCGIGGFPGVYTKIAYYMDWILDNIRN